MAVTLHTHTIVTEAELRDEVKRTSGEDDLIKGALNRATDLAKRMTGRMLVTEGTITEYHSLASWEALLELSEWPIQSITSVHEDVDRLYPASSELTEGTDFLTDNKTGHLERVQTSSAGVRTLNWQTGREAIKAIFVGGYADSDSVPWDIKDVCLRLAARLYKKAEKEWHGVSGTTDSVGNFTRFGPEQITPDMRAVLMGYARPAMPHTWSRRSVA